MTCVHYDIHKHAKKYNRTFLMEHVFLPKINVVKRIADAPSILNMFGLLLTDFTVTNSIHNERVHHQKAFQTHFSEKFLFTAFL